MNLLTAPFILVFALVAGVAGGVLYKAIACIEYLIHSNRQYIWMWKKYPHRLRQLYTATRQTSELLESGKTEYQVVDRPQPGDHLLSDELFLIFRILTNTIVVIVQMPIHMLVGIFDGPHYLIKEYLFAETIGEEIRGKEEKRDNG